MRTSVSGGVMKVAGVSLLVLALLGCASDRTLATSPESSRELVETSAGSVWRIRGPKYAPKVIARVNPIYPDHLRRDRVEGLVQMEAWIDASGNVVDVRVRSAPAHELAASASNAVRQWKFAPTVIDGVAVPVLFEVTINFKLH